MLKDKFGIGDTVKYSHPLEDPFEGHYADVKATIMEISGDKVRISCKLGSLTEPKFINIWTTFDRLTQQTQIPDPNLSTRRFAKAEKVNESSYNSWLYDDELDKYFETFEDLLEYYEDEEIEDISTFAWATKAKRLSIDNAENLVSHILENNYDDEDLYEVRDFKGLLALDEAIANFNQLNENKVLYYPDYSMAIIMEKQTFLDLKDDRGS